MSIGVSGYIVTKEILGPRIGSIWSFPAEHPLIFTCFVLLVVAVFIGIGLAPDKDKE